MYDKHGGNSWPNITEMVDGQKRTGQKDYLVMHGSNKTELIRPELYINR